MKKRIFLTIFVFALMLMVLATVVSADGGPTEAQIYEPPQTTDTTCQAVQTLLGTFPDNPILQEMADCDPNPKMPEAWEVPAGMITNVPAGYYIQGDISMVISSTEVTTGTFEIQYENVFKDSNPKTGELTWVYTDTTIYAPWGATVVDSTSKPFISANLEMRKSGCGGTCATVYSNAIDENGARRMDLDEMVSIFTADIQRMLSADGGQ